jgi:hypothetical protein
VQIEKPKLNVKDYLWMGTKGAVGLLASSVLFLAYFMLVSSDTLAQTGQDHRPHPKQEKNHPSGAG